MKIVGMSATLPNLDLLSKWLDAELITTVYRPVPLLERICFDGKIHDSNLHVVRQVILAKMPFRFPVSIIILPNLLIKFQTRLETKPISKSRMMTIIWRILAWKLF